MATQLWTNNSSTFLTDGCTIGATQINVDNSTKFADLSAGDDLFEIVTLTDGISHEIVKVTERNGNTWTIVRGQENTAPKEWLTGTVVECRLTAGALNLFTQNSNFNTQVLEYLDSEKVTFPQIQFEGIAGDTDVDATTFLGSDGKWDLVDHSEIRWSSEDDSSSLFVKSDGSFASLALGDLVTNNDDEYEDTEPVRFLKHDSTWSVLPEITLTDLTTGTPTGTKFLRDDGSWTQLTVNYIGTGTPDSTNYLRGDGTWTAITLDTLTTGTPNGSLFLRDDGSWSQLETSDVNHDGTDLNTIVVELLSNIATLTTQISDLTTEVADLTTQIGELDTRITTLEEG
jgi:hypothetical protein